MIGGLAVRGNLLGVTWSAGVGHVFLYDLDARQRVSSFATPVGPSGYSDANGIAIDRRYRVFVADPHNGRVRVCNAFGQHVGDLGAAPPADGGSARDRSGVLDRPHAVAVLDDRVWVTMGDQPRRRAVQCFATDGRHVGGLASGGDPAREFGAPRGLFADTRGIVVADTLRGRLQRFRADGTFVQEVPVAAADALARPIAVVRLADGRFCVVDRGGDGAGLVVVGTDGVRSAAGTLAEACRDPVAVALDERRRVYVLDHDGERVVRGLPDLAFDEVLVDLAEHDRDAPGGR